MAKMDASPFEQLYLIKERCNEIEEKYPTHRAAYKPSFTNFDKELREGIVFYSSGWGWRLRIDWREAWQKKRQEIEREYAETNVGTFRRQPCQQDGCANLGEPCWLPGADKEPSEWYCAEHMHAAGYCIGCGSFWAGVESFDFGPGWCDNCAPEFEDEGYDGDLDFGFFDDDDSPNAPYGAYYEDDIDEDELPGFPYGVVNPDDVYGNKGGPQC